MLQIIDQRWRQHLVEMDYLREGIHLRGIAQTDPLVAWQREGFEMFGKLMDSIDDDYLRYVMHVQVVATPSRGARLRPGHLRGRGRPGAGSASLRRSGRRRAGDRLRAGGAGAAPQQRSAGSRAASVRRRANGDADRAAGAAGRLRLPADLADGPVVGGPPAKLGRNEPCWCGSGRKFKLCHGAS